MGSFSVSLVYICISLHRLLSVAGDNIMLRAIFITPTMDTLPIADILPFCMFFPFIVLVAVMAEAVLDYIASRSWVSRTASAGAMRVLLKSLHVGGVVCGFD